MEDKNDFYYPHVGKVYNMLTVEAVVRDPRPKFVCSCSCGGSATIDVHSIFHNKTKSCGCLQKKAAAANGKKNIKPAVEVGEVFSNKKGLDFKIVEYVRSHKVLVEFIETGYQAWSAVKEIKKGSIRDWVAHPLIHKEPKEVSKRTKVEPIKEGEVFRNFYGCEYQIVAVLESAKVRVKFLDEFGYEKVVDNSSCRGGVRNPYRRNISGVGYLGEGEYTSQKDKRAFTLWTNMLTRCYDEYQLTIGVTYLGCSVSEDWHCFQNFASWCYGQTTFTEVGDWCLDKDIMIKGNKLYSSETCSFVPREINNLFTLRQNCRGDYPLGVHQNKKSGKFVSQINIDGKRVCLGHFDNPEKAFQIYKTAKEDVVRSLAEKYKSLLDSRVYDSLINWKVEVTD